MPAPARLPDRVAIVAGRMDTAPGAAAIPPRPALLVGHTSAAKTLDALARTDAARRRVTADPTPSPLAA